MSLRSGRSRSDRATGPAWFSPEAHLPGSCCQCLCRVAAWLGRVDAITGEQRSKRSCHCCQLSTAEVPMSAALEAPCRDRHRRAAPASSGHRGLVAWLCTHLPWGWGGEHTAAPVIHQLLQEAASAFRRRSWGSSPTGCRCLGSERWMKPWIVVIGARSIRSIASADSAAPRPPGRCAQRLISASRVGSLAGCFTGQLVSEGC